MTEIVRVILVAGDRLHLTPMEQEWGRLLGQQRFAINKARHAKGRVVQEDHRRLSNDQFGGMAEVAVAKWVNVCPRLPVVDAVKYPNFNLKLAAGDEVDVQWNADGLCLWDKKREAAHKDDPPVLHLVLRGDDPAHFQFAGWATHAEALAGIDADHGYGPCWELDRLRTRLEILTCAQGEGYRERDPHPEEVHS